LIWRGLSSVRYTPRESDTESLSKCFLGASKEKQHRGKLAAVAMSSLRLRISPFIILASFPHLLLAIAGGQELQRIDRTSEAMGATFSITLYGYDSQKMAAATDAAFAEATRLDEMLSNYKPESEWSKVNRTAAETAVKVSPELFQLLSSCISYSRQSNGAFDITVAPLMKTWGFYKDEGRRPNPADLKDALAKVGYRHIHLDPVAETVFFDRSGVEIDPGGVGKGYAVDRMVSILRQRRFRTAFVSASGSSIFGMGAPPGEPRGWRVEIMNPRNTNETVETVFLKDMSISTSGAYEKFFESKGRIYSHIMDPRTGEPAQGTLSVSVVAPRTIDSEVWAKPYFVNGRAWTQAHKPSEFKVFFCEDKADRACVWLR
jgi:thiamine biosynthesis lipoprotein